MKFRRVLTLCLVLGCIGGLVGCNSKSSDVVNADTKILSDAVEGLKNMSGTYIVSNSLELPDKDNYYIEVNNANGSYTEYPVDSSGGYGTVPYASASNTNYILYDWLTSSNKLYTLNGSYNSTDTSNDNMWISMPDAYSSNVASRKLLYIDKMLSGIKDFKVAGTDSMDLGSGKVDVTFYTATLSSSNVKDICGVDTLGLYQSIKAEAEISKDTNTITLMNKYIEELNMSLTFSDAKLTFGIYDGVVRYMKLEAGGLGTRMFYTKTVLTQSFTERALPDFTSCKKYMSNIKSLADYVAKYNSYEDAMTALYGSETATGGNNSSSSATK